MMASGKQQLVAQIEIKSGDDVFHELFSSRPHHISNMAPALIQGCELHDGDWGQKGSVIFWNYTHDGEQKVAKMVIESLDEAKKYLKFKVIEGDLLELYKTCEFSLHVDTHGESHLVTWTVDYEKKSEEIPDPTSLIDFGLALTKDIEAHHLNST